MSLLRFHWEFFGPDAQQTAEHFKKHLEEFADAEGIGTRRTYLTTFPRRVVSTLECEESHLVLVRDRLKPKRAERVHD